MRPWRRSPASAVSTSCEWSGTILGQCRVLRRLRVRPDAALDGLRDSISLSVYYGAETDLSGSCIVALSQSGETPDVLAYVERARARGALTIGITNDPRSALGEAAELVLPLAAGEERSIAATKTYTTQVAALALLAAHAAGQGAAIEDGIRAVADQLYEAMPLLERRLSEVALALAFVGRMFVIGRGPEFATAREISLKLLETCRVAAEPLTATDLVHGPLAALDGMFPVWVIGSNDESLPAVREAAARAHAAGATLVASGPAAHEIAGAGYYAPVPTPGVTLLSPLLSVVAGQLLPGRWPRRRDSIPTGRPGSARSRTRSDILVSTTDVT